MANLIFKNIELHNFMSYEEAYVDLDKNGYICVKGINNNVTDMAQSNGSGKSSIFSAIIWCLTGQTTSGAKDVSNIYLDGETSVTLDFELDEDMFKVKRTKNPSNLFVYKNEEDKSGKGIRDTDKILSDLLGGITFDVLSSVVVLGQGLPHRFTNNSPSGRKEVLESLSKSDYMIQDLRDKLTSRKQALNKTLRSNEDKVIELKTQLTLVDKSLENCTSELSDIDELQNRYKILNDVCDKTATIVNDTEFQIETLNQQLKDIVIEGTNLSAEYVDKYKSLSFIEEVTYSSKISVAKNSLEAVQADINNLKSFGGICPTCGQPVDEDTIDFEEYYSLISQYENEIEENTSLLEDAKRHNDKIKNDLDIEYQDRQSVIDIKKKDIEQDISELTLLYRKQKQDLETSRDDLNKVLYILKRVDEIKERQETLLQQKQDLEKNILYYNNVIENTNKHIDVNNKMNNLISRDFRGKLLANVIDYINTKSKIYSRDVFDTDKIEFVLDGNNISISYDGKEYELLSGGEKQKIDVIVQLALRDMLCKFLDFSCNILVLDEITDSLDQEGAQRVFNLISNNLCDVKTIYLISHHGDFEIPYDDEIVVIKGEDKISRIL